MDPVLPNDFREFLELLNANRVKYILIGGFAVGFYGYPRTTNDIDIFISDGEENSQRLVKTLKEFAFSTDVPSADIFTTPNSLVEIGIAPVKIEILNFASGLEFEKAYANRIIDTIEGVEVSMISLDDLKINKKASGRYKDLEDLEQLDKLSEESK